MNETGNMVTVLDSNYAYTSYAYILLNLMKLAISLEIMYVDVGRHCMRSILLIHYLLASYESKSG